MALNFPNGTRSYEETRRRVSFIGHDGMFEVPFFVQTDALPVETGGEEHYLAAFDATRARIHDVAREAYGNVRRTEYILTAADFR